MSPANMAAVKMGVGSVASSDVGASGRLPPRESSAEAFAAMHAQRMGSGSEVSGGAVARPAALSAVDRPPTLGDAILNTLDRMGQSAREHWSQVAAPLNPAVGFNSADLLNRQMHLQRFMLEVEFASLLSKQAAKTVDQISRTQ